MNPNTLTVISTDDLNRSIDEFREQGFRLDMIFPADAPREALMSVPPAVAGGLSPPTTTVSRSDQRHFVRLTASTAYLQPPATANGSDWIRGRAGMEYRDLIPGRMGGKVIASHIRLTTGGEVPDYVHFHKIEFQMIYCKRGRIKVVYEDQGPPFWLTKGDCVLQPPEIRHRVLECTAGAEVIEVSMPAEHETWVEHDLTLPTSDIMPDRDFGGQRFVRHVAADAEWSRSEFDGFESLDTGIAAATNGLADVRVLRSASSAGDLPSNTSNEHELVYLFPLEVAETLVVSLKI